MAAEVKHELALRNAELSTRVEELTIKLAQNEALSQLAAGTVHDLRNVFHVALLAAESLLNTLRDPEEQELAQTILAAAEQGTMLSQDMLAFARRPQSLVTDCAELLPRLQRLIERIAFNNFECHFELSPALGLIAVDPAQLEAAIINLSINARDAMPQGGKLHVRAGGMPEDAPLPAGLARGSYVEFSLTDTGHGMSRDVLARATEAFFTTKASRGGTGLGLATAHAFAVRSGGALQIESQLGAGTCVRLILPRPARARICPSACRDNSAAALGTSRRSGSRSGS
jgi:signal transduction histidine kinase